MAIDSNLRHQPAQAALAVRIRRWRDERGWSQQELASRAGIARSTLSKIENELLSPTFEVLLKLARGFDTKLSDLVQSESRWLTGRMVIERSVTDHPAVAYPNNQLWPLAGTLKRRVFQSAIVEFTHTEIATFGPWNTHPTDDLLLVLSGQLVFHSEGYETAHLNPGDSVHFDGNMPHACLSAKTMSCRCLYVYSTR